MILVLTPNLIASTLNAAASPASHDGPHRLWPAMANVRTMAGATVALLALVACGQAQPATSAARSVPSTAAPPAAPASAPPSPTLPAVPDFPVVAYQGDQVFGGHQGHFSAAFAAGRPVVLLYFAGL
jgi:hypothetical protein